MSIFGRFTAGEGAQTSCIFLEKMVFPIFVDVQYNIKYFSNNLKIRLLQEKSDVKKWGKICKTCEGYKSTKAAHNKFALLHNAPSNERGGSRWVQQSAGGGGTAEIFFAQKLAHPGKKRKIGGMVGLFQPTTSWVSGTPPVQLADGCTEAINNKPSAISGGNCFAPKFPREECRWW